MKPIVSVIIPTYNNPNLLHQAVVSLLRNHATKNIMEIIVVNNGHEQSCDFLKGQKTVRVIDTGKNLGWEGGIMRGIKESESEFICMFNDDAMVPPASRLWLNILLQHFRDPKVAAVGPSSNVVMGLQNIFLDIPYHVFERPFLIGFCVLMRRSAFLEIGGMDESLPGGDDFDWSIRLRDKGYKLLVDRNVFVYHHGFQTGNRAHGDHTKPNGWNSFDKTHAINTALIKKHGLIKWWETQKGAWEWPKVEHTKAWEDAEGDIIRGIVTDKEKKIIDLGCANNKTLKRAVGVDFIPKGERITSLDGDPISDADVMADVSTNLPFDDGSQDVIICRHLLEHMLSPILALSIWIKKLKKGGKLILALPNQDWHSTIPMNVEHVGAYNPESATILLTAMGLEDVKIHDSHNSISFIIEGRKA